MDRIKVVLMHRNSAAVPLNLRRQATCNTPFHIFVLQFILIINAITVVLPFVLKPAFKDCSDVLPVWSETNNTFRFWSTCASSYCLLSWSQVQRQIPTYSDAYFLFFSDEAWSTSQPIQAFRMGARNQEQCSRWVPRMKLFLIFLPLSPAC